MSGSLPVTLEKIVHFNGNGSLIAGDNYYQAIGTSTDNYSMLIKRGADYRKGVRTLSNILDQASEKRIDDSRLDPVSLVPTKVNKNLDFLRGMGADSAIVKVLEYLHSSLVDKKDRLLSQIVQVAQVLYGDSYRFWVRVRDKADIPEAKLSPENALSRMVVESNPKVNDQCPNPMFDEKVVSRLVTSLGFEFLLARERMIRNEILKNCTFTRCLKNRVSVVCCNKNFERSVQDELQYCEGQAEITNVFEEGTRTGGVYYNKSKSGCVDLSKINERVKQMRARQAAS